MTSSNKAKSQLLDTMRMSKNGVSDTVAQGATASSAAPAKESVQKASKKKTKATKAPSSKKSAAPAKAGSSSVNQDPFQAARRVWPD